MNTINVLVFPCGSEIGLEIYRSLSFSSHINLFGANSIDDHGRFVYKEYIGNLPFISSNEIIPVLKKIVKQYNIDAIYPAMDSVIVKLVKYEKEIGCKIISSDLISSEICFSKKKTYDFFANILPIPAIYSKPEQIEQFPVFAKPDIGYGSRGVKKISDQKELTEHMCKYPDSLILEYLPGKEYTIDCFTNYKRELLFIGPRERKRILNGISVNTSTMPVERIFMELAEIINDRINLNGAWFFQVKERDDRTLVLMEIACRLGGSFAVYRAKGINFALLSVYNIFEIPVSITPNSFNVELDRALSNKYLINIKFEHVYVDFDDTIVIKGVVNPMIISAIYHFINQGKKIHLLTKHEEDIFETLKKYRLGELFDEIIQIEKQEFKYLHIKYLNSIFIDDSYIERRYVNDNLSIPVFSPDSLECFV